VGAREVLPGEAARLEHRYRERIAHGERSGGAGGGREIQRAGFLGHADIERTLAARASVESVLPVITMSGTARRLRWGSSSTSSGVSPEFDSASTHRRG